MPSTRQPMRPRRPKSSRGWLARLFAWRYLVSPKSHSVINIIARVSLVAVGVPVAAMVILLSVFNGFEGLVRGMYSDFDPDIAVFPARGKVFTQEDLPLERLLSMEGVAAAAYVLEDNALLEYRGRQQIATLRGVDTTYASVVPMERMTTQGRYQLRHGELIQAVVGQGLAYNLGVATALPDPIKALVPRRGAGFSTLLPIDSYRERAVFPAGIFTLDAETDTKYMIVPIEFARELLDYPDGASSVAMRLAPGVDAQRMAARIAGELGEEFRPLTRHEQKASLYRIMMYEKWGIFTIVLMVMIIASFSIVGSLAMLIVDKRRDIGTLRSMGADRNFVRGVFVREGMLICTLGQGAGMVFGLLLCWAQRTFSLIKIPADTFLVDAYPVDVQPADIVAIAVACIAVSYIITKFTVARMTARI